MEALRWILLTLAVLLLAGVYWFGRRRAQNKRDDVYQSSISDVPSFSARDRDDDWQQGVGPVRVVSGRDRLEIPRLKPELDGHIIEPSDAEPESEPEPKTSIEQVPEEFQVDQPAKIVSETVSAQQPDTDSIATETIETSTDTDDYAEETSVGDVIVLYLVAHRGEYLKGEQLLSAAIASGLQFGDMAIFHRLDQQQKILYSLSDMIEPGSFVYEKMHDHKTRGVSLFIQLNLCTDPVQALDDMLICAHNLASMLDLQICDHNRQLLTESVASSLRARAKHVHGLKQQPVIE
ncbi:MAG: cell division protein ZipA [Gammaproteobacteria bacterium]